MFSELGEQGKVEGKSSPGGHWGGGGAGVKSEGPYNLDFTILHRSQVDPLSTQD